MSKRKQHKKKKTARSQNKQKQPLKKTTSPTKTAPTSAKKQKQLDDVVQTSNDLMAKFDQMLAAIDDSPAEQVTPAKSKENPQSIKSQSAVKSTSRKKQVVKSNVQRQQNKKSTQVHSVKDKSQQTIHPVTKTVTPGRPAVQPTVATQQPTERFYPSHATLIFYPHHRVTVVQPKISVKSTKPKATAQKSVKQQEKAVKQSVIQKENVQPTAPTETFYPKESTAPVEAEGEGVPTIIDVDDIVFYDQSSDTDGQVDTKTDHELAQDLADKSSATKPSAKPTKKQNKVVTATKALADDIFNTDQQPTAKMTAKKQVKSTLQTKQQNVADDNAIYYLENGATVLKRAEMFYFAGSIFFAVAFAALLFGL